MKPSTIFSTILAVFLFSIIAFAVSIPLTNNVIASNVRKDLIRLPLPEGTEILDSISVAGKLIGNGNGMQYFGAILIKSELSLDELNQYYQPYRKNEWSQIVHKQTSNRIDIIEHGVYSFDKWDSGEDNYIVYTWGSSEYSLRDWDIRGH